MGRGQLEGRVWCARARKASRRSAVVLACVAMVGCGGGGAATGSGRVPATSVCRPTRTLHEHALAGDPALRASFDGLTILHLESHDGDAPDARDTATTGVDRIPYVVDAPTTRRLTIGDGPVARATLRNARGTPVASVDRGASVGPVALAAGAYTLELTSDGAADAIVAVAPESCVTPTATTPGRSRDAATTYTTPGVYIQELPGIQTVTPVPTGVPVFVGTTTSGPTTPTFVTSLDDYTATFGAPSAASFVSLAVAQFFANGGGTAWVVATSTTGAVPSAAELVGGLASLDDLQGWFTLALPDLARLDPADAVTVTSAAATYAAAHQAFLVADAPTTFTTVASITEWVTTTLAPALSSDAQRNTAVYFPPLATIVPGTTASVTTGASGVVAGRIAATDTAVGTWQSPAGVTYGAVAPGALPTLALTEQDASLLDPANVNPILTLVTYGEVVWGARTLAGAADAPFGYVSARRTLLLIEQSLRQSLQWVVFEPNDQELWGAVTRDVSAFLDTLYQEGAFFGDTASQAFFVTCDASNNPPDTRALGQLYIDVGVALVMPAEFTIIRVTQTTEGPDA